MRTFPLVILGGLLSLLLLLSLPSKVIGCADIIALYLERQPVEETFRTGLLDVSQQLNLAEARLHQKDVTGFRETLSLLTAAWFSFYNRYAQNPPAQWIPNRAWIDRLSLVTRAVGNLRKADPLNYEEVHEIFRSIHENLTAILKERIPLSEQLVLDLLEEKLRNLQPFTTDSETRAVELNNLRTLARYIEEENHASGTSETLINPRSNLLHALNRFLEADTDSIQLETVQKSLDEYQQHRATELKSRWFKP